VRGMGEERGVAWCRWGLGGVGKVGELVRFWARSCPGGNGREVRDAPYRRVPPVRKKEKKIERGRGTTGGLAGPVLPSWPN
jgi:hypothetical protein